MKSETYLACSFDGSRPRPYLVEAPATPLRITMKRRFLEHGMGGKVLYLIRATPIQNAAR